MIDQSSEGTRETLHILRGIPGGDKLVTWLEYPDYFHDFADDEIVSLQLDRSNGSTLTLRSGRRIGETWWNATIIFKLRDIIDVHLDGFMHQNVIGGLTIRLCPPIDYHPSLIGIGGTESKHQIMIEPCAGAFGSINATITEIEMSEPSEDKDGES